MHLPPHCELAHIHTYGKSAVVCNIFIGSQGVNDCANHKFYVRSCYIQHTVNLFVNSYFSKFYILEFLVGHWVWPAAIEQCWHMLTALNIHKQEVHVRINAHKKHPWHEARGSVRTLSCTWLSQDSVFHLALSGLSLAPGSLRTLSCTWLSQDSVLYLALSGLCLVPGSLRTLSCTWLSQDSVFHLALSGLCLAPGSLRTLSCTWLSQDSVLHLALSGLCLDPLVFI